MKKNIWLYCVLFISVFAFNACEKDDPEPPGGGEEELITTITFTLIPKDDGPTAAFSFVDLDGDGGDDPVITGDKLRPNITYMCSLEFLNESETPAVDITEEIQAESEEHQIFFSTTIDGISFGYDDQDMDGNPLGLQSTLTTGEDGSGTITIILRHEPDKTAIGVSSGDITNAGGSTDVEVSFPVDVE